MMTGNIVRDAIPTAIELPNDTFHSINQGNLFVVQLAQTCLIQYSLDPSVVMLGPYQQQVAGTKLVAFWNCVLLPFRYMQHFLSGPLDPRRALEIVGAKIIADNREIELQGVL